MGKFLDKAKYVSILGVLSLLLASTTAFFWGVSKTIDAMVLIVTSYGKDPFISVSLIEVVDSLLIATALFVFAVSMYKLFIADLPLPNWMVARDLYQLKDKLGGVIILVMVVKFVERLVEWKDPYESFLFAIAISIVSAVLIALSHFGKKDGTN
jgi:uncharacterized membrane protein YqhA